MEFIHRDDALLIPLAEPSRRNGRARFLISYGGVPADGLRIGPNRHGQRSFFSNNWPNRARHWLPTVDHPYDKATSEFVVTAPDHYQVVSNGLLVEETDLPGGLRRTHWRQRVPIATWLFALGVTRFAVEHREPFGSVPIQTWVFQEDRDEGFRDFAVPTRSVLGFYAERVGPFAYEKVANVQSTSVGGGMEAATAIFYAEESVTGERAERWRRVIIHELAHHWFGNAVTEYDWDDVWLSEGFATYFTLLYIEHADGRDAFVDALRDARRGVVEFYRENPDYRTVHADLDDMSRVTSYPGIYQKGAWVLHMLRRRVGDSAFWEGIRLYYARHMNGNATTEDFRLAMEGASGDDLEGFFRQWLLEGGIPTLSGRWAHDAERGVVRVELRQVGPRTFRLPVEVGVHLPGRERPRVGTTTLTDRRGSL
ncbi:MAG: M1 family peptidase, partial [Thermoplasmata archaeon]|nr:M1 family metallopeptidase [Gemmatimonadota bacterium]NIT90303.1 M1 family metallopeptidase [Gemmatimonadota bacterium]NIW89580.1 M1 family peptidase [Thermoplasmata archaeon]